MSCRNSIKPFETLDFLSGDCFNFKTKRVLINKKYQARGCFTSNHSFGMLSNRYFKDFDDARCNYLDGVQYNIKLFVKRINKYYYLSYSEIDNPVIVNKVSKHVTPQTTYYYYLSVSADGRLITKRLIAEVVNENYVAPIWEEVKSVIKVDELPPQVRCKVGFTIGQYNIPISTNEQTNFTLTYKGTPFQLVLNGIIQPSETYTLNGGQLVWQSIDLLTTDNLTLYTYYANGT